MQTPLLDYQIFLIRDIFITRVGYSSWVSFLVTVLFSSFLQLVGTSIVVQMIYYLITITRKEGRIKQVKKNTDKDFEAERAEVMASLQPPDESKKIQIYFNNIKVQYNLPNFFSLNVIYKIL